MSKKNEPPSVFLKQEGTRNLSGKNIGYIAASVLEKGASIRFSARGFSMYPFILDQDIITIHPFHGEPLSVGKVVALIAPESEKLFVHRIIGLQEGKYLIKGDNVDQPDGLLPSSAIIGIVNKVERDRVSVNFGDPIANPFFPTLFRLKLQSYFLKIMNTLFQNKRIEIRG